MSEFTSDKTDSYVNCDNQGYLSEADSRYAKELHDHHNDLPFMSEKQSGKAGSYNLNDKKNKVVHMKALNQALKHVLILEKVHRVIEFNQRAWLRPYIEFNTQLRSQAENDFEKTSSN